MREQAPLTKTKGSKQYTARNHCTLYTSSYSGCYFFAWDSTLPFSACCAR